MNIGNTYKNVKMVKARQDGYDIWHLYHVEPDGREWKDAYFEFFTEQLLPGEGGKADAKKTRDSYSRWTGHFIDFVIEAVNYEKENGRDVINGYVVAQLIKKYPKFLAHADESGDKLVAEVAKRLNAQRCAPSTQSTYIAAINKYLNLSEDFNAMMRELGITDIDGRPLYSEEDLFPAAFGKKAMSTTERIALNKHSVLAAVMCGGARLKRIAKLAPLKSSAKAAATKKSGQQIDSEEVYVPGSDFPFQYSGKLIMDGFRSLRNKALFCLLMACGCRIHEALLLTWRDIDTARRIVWLRDPHGKKPEEFGGFFSSMSEIESLPWKGRATERTVLIEPFKTHFWKLLAEYRKSKEFTLTNNHNFVFQITKRTNKGAPLFTSNYSDIAKAMVEACERIGIAPMRPHSLRHMFGIYCLNFIPFVDGTYGMSMSMVRDIMGHATITSTQRYAIPDTKLLLMRQKVNYAAIQGFTVDTSTEHRLLVLQSELKNLQREIEHQQRFLEQSN